MDTIEWAVPQQSRLKYGQLFNTTDRQRSGFLTGVQARNILLQSGLAQQILAQIWFLADIDKDGMLTSEEFMLAMHLIDWCKSGKPLPTQLPPELIPPSVRRKISLVSPTLSDKGRITPIQAATSTRHGSVSSVSSGTSSNHVIPAGPSPVPAALNEWAVPQTSRLKYTQGFNTADKDRSGFLTGTQARGILIQSGLPQQTLAGIWNLSDTDKDGRLSLEEFVLAMHLIDLVRSGEPLPSVLPVELVPPGYRRKQSLTGAPMAVPTASGAQISIPTAVTAGAMPIPNTGAVSGVGGDGMFGKHSFEDKRKENFEKGQAELEKRRQMLLDQQKREQEERERKEREEFEKRERARLEQERRKQEEIERQLAKQRELEQQKEEERRKQLEQREAARREMERQRLIEWEAQKKSEMALSRQRFQEQLVTLRARKQTSAVQVEQMNNQLADIKQQVDEARERVSNAKSEIDEMRVQRDTRLRDMNQLKAQVKQLHDRQTFIEQERLRLTAQLTSLQANPASATGDSTEFALKAKQGRIAQLKQRLREIEPEKQCKLDDQSRVKTELDALIEEFESQLSATEQVKSINERKREEAQTESDQAARIAEQASKIATTLDFNSGWEDAAPAPVASSTLASGSVSGTFNASDLSTSTSGSETCVVRYRAIYDFVAQNPDELSFKVNDIIVLVPGEAMVTGWLKGKLNTSEGWFPEVYVQKLDDSVDSSSGTTLNVSNLLSSTSTSFGDTTGGEVMATVHTAYEASDDTQMSLGTGDRVRVTDRSQQDWWFGSVKDRSGWFPSACVTLDGKTGEEAEEYYVSLYAFATQEPGDLSFEANELIRVTKREVEWWTGQIGSKSGIFPANFVRPATEKEISSFKTESKLEEKASTPIIEDNKNETTLSKKISIPDTNRTPESPRLKKTKSKKPEIVRVIADYKATGENQINLEKGQLIQVRKKADSGWWEGEVQVKGKKRQIGWFPASYVKPLIGPASDGSSARSTPDSAIKDVDTSTKKVRALYSYQAQQSDELSFEAGDVMKIITEEDATWWKGESESSGKSGLFPSSYVEPIKSEIHWKFDQSNLNLEPTSFEAAAAYLDDDNSSFYSDTEDEPNDEEDDALDDSDSDEGSAQLTNRIANDSEFKRQLLQQLLKFEQSLSVQPETTAKAVDQPFNEQKRNFCINELINSESNYVLNLHRVCIYFEQPLRCSRLVSRSMLDATFTPLNQLYRLQHSFEQQLQSAGSNFSSTKTLGQVLCEFFENGDLSMVYMAFCSKQLKVFHYLASQRLIKSELSVLLSNCEQRFAIDVARTQSQAHCSPIPLHGHLLQPMQRITRYPLLLRDILNHTPLQHSDKVLLQRALDKAEQLCNQVNDHCRKLESEKRLDWMQRHVHTFGLEYVLQFNTETRLMGDRALLQAGILIKITTKRKLMAFLCNDMLVLTIPLSSIGRPTELSQSDRALRGKYRLYRKPYLLHELTIVSESSALNEQLGDRITQLNGFVLGIKSSGKMLMLQSPRINVTKLWAKNLHQAIQKAKVANQLSLNVKHEEAPLLQSFDASMPISGQMTLILLECNNMISTNLMLSMYCVISFGVGTDPTVHSQTTRTALIRQLPTVASVRSRLSWSGNEKLSSSIRIKNLFQKRSSLHEAAEDNNPNCSDKKRLTPKILPEFVKTNQQVGASSWSSPSASSRTYSATINFMTTFLLPRADLTKHHLVMTFYEQSPYRPDHLFAQTAVPLLYLKQQTAPPLPVSVFDEPLTLKTHKRTGQIPNIRFKVQFKKQN